MFIFKTWFYVLWKLIEFKAATIVFVLPVCDF